MDFVFAELIENCCPLSSRILHFLAGSVDGDRGLIVIGSEDTVCIYMPEISVSRKLARALF